MSSRNIVVITGLSGSGKSTAAKTFEDIGFFCIDNLPVDLVPKLIELVESGGSELNRLALVIDLRQRKFFPRYAAILNSLELHDTSFEILFLEARDEVLIRRYSETRRQHPLAPTGSLIDGITREREELEQNKRHRNTDHRGKNIRHQLGSAEYAMHQEHHDVLNQKIRDIRNEESQHLG